jgi:hypothetical protein
MSKQSGIVDFEEKLSLIQEYISVNSNVELEKMVLETNIPLEEIVEISILIEKYPCSFNKNDKFIIEEGRCINVVKNNTNMNNHELECNLRKSTAEIERLKAKIKLLEMYIQKKEL